MKILISGEGNSDVGERDYITQEFLKGPITLLIENLLHHLYSSKIEFDFVFRLELKKFPITLRGKKKKGNFSSGKGHANLAYKLAVLAREKQFDVAILMRDASRKKFQEIYQEIHEGFNFAQYSQGIAAVPVPESEAWLISCEMPSLSAKIEQSKKEMKGTLKNLLQTKNLVSNKETWRKIATECPVDQVRAPSFLKLKEDLEQLLNNI